MPSNPIDPILAAQFYDVSVQDWLGEIDFYKEYALEAKQTGSAILELACGTGRIAIRLARLGVRVVGIDLSSAMLELARGKSQGLQDVRWLEADMRAFEVDQRFRLVIIPAHSFQFMLTASDQMTCLERIWRHLLPGGRLIVHLDHQDMGWLGGLCNGQGGAFKPSEELVYPHTGRTVRVMRAWTYERSTQTAEAVAAWEEYDSTGAVANRWERGPVRLHCVFRFEMEHLLNRAGYEIETLYGDFLRAPLGDSSTEMIWVARRPESS